MTFSEARLHSFRTLEQANPHVAGSGSPQLLAVSDLRVSFATASGVVRAVDGVSFELRKGEVFAIVGESGSGKSACAMTLMGLTRGPHATISGSARLEDRELLSASERELRRIRGARMAMIFQDPQSSLNPVYRVGEQIAEQIRAHEPLLAKGEALARAEALMERVEIPRAHERLRAYPHELSGGMRQRVMIAMALSLGAEVLLADEPTTALDVTVQSQILARLKELREQDGLSILLITHDFGVVAEIADRVAVMRAGQIVEHGAASAIFDAPEHPYTRSLLDALVPPARRAPSSQPGPRSPSLLAIEDLRVRYPGRRGSAPVDALAGVSLTVEAGETLAIVGESGCGKTTLLRSIVGLAEPTGGSIELRGDELAAMSSRALARRRQELGMVFQDSQASLNPRLRVGTTLARALRAHGHERASAPTEAGRLLERVGLTRDHAARYPHELSGGERQRVGIARALAGTPKLVLLDEPVSSLDASIRRGVIELLVELQAQLGCSYVLVSHDFTTVEALADRIAVMYAGEVVELGAAEQVLERPRHPYTRELLAACPRLPGGVRSEAWADRTTSPVQPGSPRKATSQQAAPRPEGAPRQAPRP